MTKKKAKASDQKNQVVNGSQTNIGRDVQGTVLSGKIDGPVATDNGEAANFRNVGEVVYKPTIIINYPRTSNDADRMTRLNELDRESKARCIASWQALGVSRVQASELAADSSIGAPNHVMVPTTEVPIIVLVGDFGVGKSLIAERLFQNAILRLRNDDNAPVPIYLKAQSTTGQLIEHVKGASAGIGNPNIQGAAIIIDGADETGLGHAAELLTEARILVGSWAQTTVVITSRPIPTFTGKEEIVQVPCLSETEAHDLVSKFAGQTITQGMIGNWPESVRDSICRPLFAILLGIYLRKQEINIPRSTGELLAFLIEQALQESRASLIPIEELLWRLAVLCTDWGGAVPIAEVALSGPEKQQILNSRLVIEQSGNIAFPLPILTQWFAAQSLAEGMPTPQELADDPQRLEHWRYPLIIFTGTYGHDIVSSVLDILARTHPAFVTDIIKESISKWGRPQDVPLPPLHECGNRIRHAMQAWVEGLGPLAQLIAPVRKDKKLAPLGLRSNQSWIEASWYSGEEDFPEIHELPHDIGLFSKSRSMLDWPSIRCSTPSKQPAWAWQWTLDELVQELSQLLQRRNLPIIGEPFFSEAMWQAMLKLTERGSPQQDPIPLSEIETRLSAFPENVAFVTIDKWQFSLSDLWKAIDCLRENNETELYAPWPGPNIALCRSYWIWEPYTPEQIFARAKVVYAGALKGYQQIVNQWFPNFAHRLQTSIKLPARLIGTIDPDATDGNRPSIKYYLEPLPLGSETEVDFHIGKRSYSDQEEQLNLIWERTRALRPQSVGWLNSTVHEEALEIFGPQPITEIVYTWLWDDLKYINWVNGLLT